MELVRLGVKLIPQTHFLTRREKNQTDTNRNKLTVKSINCISDTIFDGLDRFSLCLTACTKRSIT